MTARKFYRDLLRFIQENLYTPEKVKTLFARKFNKGQGNTVTSSKPRRKNIVSPSVFEVEKYLCAWDDLENYRLQENALKQIVFWTCL